MLIATLTDTAAVVRVAQAALQEQEVFLALEGIPSGGPQLVELRATGLREHVCVEAELRGVPTETGCPLLVRPVDDIGFGELLAFVARHEALLEGLDPEAKLQAATTPITSGGESAPSEPVADAEPNHQSGLNHESGLNQESAKEAAAKPAASPVEEIEVENTQARAEPEPLAKAPLSSSDEVNSEAEGDGVADSEMQALIDQAPANEPGDEYDEQQSAQLEAAGDTPEEGGGLADPESGFLAFFGGLTSAVARTGYYDKDHPEVMRQVQPLVDATTQVLESRGELTIVRRGGGTKAELVVWEPTSGRTFTLDELLPSTGAASMGARMTEFFVRRRLMALTLKEGIKNTELVGVLDLLSGAEGEVTELRDQFMELGLDYVSALFEQDRLGVDRTLPWHVELCISRVARDLRALPIFKGADSATIRQLRIQLVADVVRPLRDPHLVSVMLENCDLISDVASENEDAFDPAEVICEALGSEVAVGVAGYVLDQLEDAAKARVSGVDLEDEELSSRPEQIIQLLAARFLHERNLETDEMLRQLHGRAVVAFQDLPDDLKLWIKAGTLCDDLLKDAREVLSELAELRDISFANQVSSLCLGVQILTQRGELKAMASLFDWASSKSNGAPAADDTREGQWGRVRDMVKDAEVLVPLAEAFLRGDPRLRESAKRMLVFAEQHGAEALCRARRKLADDEIHRPRFVRLMREIGAKAMPALTRMLAAMTKVSGQSPGPIEDCVRALTLEPHGRAGACVAHFLTQSDDVAVRRACTAALPQLWGEKAVSYLRLAVNDDDDGVLIGVFRGLRRMSAVDEATVEKVRELMSLTSGVSDELLASAAISLGNPDSVAVVSARACLIEAIENKNRGIFSRLKGVPLSSESPLAVQSIARALIDIGGDGARDAVERRMKGSKGELKRSLQAVLGA